MLRNIAAAGAMLAFALSPGSAFAVPIDGSIAGKAAVDNPIEPVRLYCMNRYTGAFLYWGRCRGYVYYRPRPRYRYRVYCRNRFTHRFLHWGYC